MVCSQSILTVLSNITAFKNLHLIIWKLFAFCEYACHKLEKRDRTSWLDLKGGLSHALERLAFCFGPVPAINTESMKATLISLSFLEDNIYRFYVFVLPTAKCL